MRNGNFISREPTHPRRWSSIRFDRPYALLYRSRARARVQNDRARKGERRQVGPGSLDKWSENSRLLIRRCIKYVRANGSPVLKVHRRCMLCLSALSPSTAEICSSASRRPCPSSRSFCASSPSPLLLPACSLAIYGFFELRPPLLQFNIWKFLPPFWGNSRFGSFGFGTFRRF